MIEQQKERTLHHGQTRLVTDSKRTEHLVLAGVRYGKSHFGCVWHHYRVKKNAARGAKISLIVAPDYKLAEQICLEYYRDHLLRCNLVEGRDGDFYINRAKLVIHFPKLDHRILILTGEKPDKIVGFTASHAWIDESALCDPQVRKNVLKRCSYPCEYQQVLHTTTPIGSENWLFDVFGPHKVPRIEGTPHSVSDTRLVLHGRTHDNPYLPARYLRMLEAEFGWDAAYYANYILGEWVSLSRNRFYFKFDEGRHVGDYAPRFTTPHIYLTFDNNTGHLAWAALQPFGPKVAVVKANDSDAANIEVACEEVLRAFPPSMWGNHYVTVYGDAVLWHWSNLIRETGFGLIRKLLQPHFPRLEIRAPRDNPGIHDRSIVTNRAFAEDRLMIDRNCKKVILSARTTQTTKDGKVKKESKDVITHPMEAVDRVIAAIDGLLIRR